MFRPGSNRRQEVGWGTIGACEEGRREEGPLGPVRQVAHDALANGRHCRRRRPAMGQARRMASALANKGLIRWRGRPS